MCRGYHPFMKDTSPDKRAVSERDQGGSILKLAKDEQDEERELDFDVRALRRLTTAQRFEMMLRRSRETAELLRAHGHGRPAEIVKRS